MSDRDKPVDTGGERGDLTELLRRVASLMPEQRVRLEERLLAGRAAAPVETRIRRRPAGERCPLSLTQQRLWFLDQLLPGSTVYNEPTALRLEGRLDVASLARALDEIVARHEALRTVFRAAEGEPFQDVQPPRSLDLEPLDLSAFEGTARDAALAEALAETAARPFELSASWPIRARLVRLGPLDHVLVIVTHHIASDGWSTGVLFRELGTLYGAFSAGRPSPLPPLAVQYGDFAVWQRHQLAGGELERQVAYWRQQLAGLPAEVTLLTDRPRPVAPTHRGARETRMLPNALVGGLKALGRSENATLFMTLLAGFLALLHRYTGQPDVVVGAPIAGRSRVEIEPLIGFFVGTLALRGDLRGDPTARELVRRARNSALDAYANQDVPFERLVEELAPERRLDRNPLVQVLLALQPRRELPDLPGLEVDTVPITAGRAKLDLSVHVRERSAGLEVVAIYSTELFDPETIERLLEHFEILLQGMVEAPETQLSELPLLPARERHRLLVEWNATARAHVGPSTIHGLVAAQAARTPSAAALVWRGREIGYAEVDTAANRLARHLQALGAAPERTVAVCVRRSPALVTALLSVLKAGAAYVPLDPMWPDERLRLLLTDSGAGLVLTEADLAVRLGEGPWQVVCLDRDAEQWRERPASPPEDGAGAESLAYMAYTSGSTGRPKGILCTHGGAVNYLAFVLGTYGLGPADVVLPRSSVAFDATVREIFGTLAAGARMVLLDDDEVRDPIALLEAVRGHGVTVLTLVPTLLRAVSAAAEEDTRPAPSLRLLLVSGEPLFVADVRSARAALAPRTEVVNQYGPSECTIISTYHRAGPDEDGRDGVPIGRPVWNARVYVLDGRLQPVPIGVAGELHIGGVGVARGYLGPVELTTERFLPDPFDARPGARMYRTGDRGRWRSDGVLEYFGRVDDQVKIRGNRVEPGEVEARLRECPGVSQAAVIAWPAGAPDTRLVAYVVPAEGAAAPSAAELRTALRRALPDFMVPTAFVALAALPLGPHGKLDRRALPPPGDAGPAAAYRKPRHPLEWQIAGIWSALLKVPQVGVFDDFFELGGHSLLAVQLMHQLEVQVGSRVPLTALFSTPTVAGLAAAVQRQETIGPDLVVSLRASGAEPPFFFFHGDYNGGGFYSRGLARGLSPEQPFYAVHPHPLTDRPVPDTMAAMVTELVAAIRAVRPRGPYRLGGHCNGGMFAFEVARRLVAEGDEVDGLVVIDAGAGNARFRSVRRLARALAWLGRLDRRAEAALFVSLRDRALALASRVEGWRHPRTAPPAAGRRMAGPTPSDAGVHRHGGEDLDLVASARTWQESERVTAFRQVARSHVPGRYAGSIVLLVPEQRRSLRRDLWWSLVADRVEVHTIPGAHLTSITEHGTDVAERLQACLAGTPRARSAP